MQPLEELESQSQLQTWVEYQDWQFRYLEYFQKAIAKYKKDLVSARQALDDAGLPAFEDGLESANRGNGLALAIQFTNKVDPLDSRIRSAKGDLALAEHRLQAARSDAFGPAIERAAWIARAGDEIRSAQQHLEHVLATGYRPEDWEEGGRFAQQPGEDRSEWLKKEADAQGRHFDAKGVAYRRLDLVEKALAAAQSDDIGERVQRAALVGMVEGEIQSARKEINETRKQRAEIELKQKPLDALVCLQRFKRKLADHKVLLQWIEKQRQLLLSTHSVADSSGEARLPANQSEGRTTRSLLRRPLSEASQLIRPLRITPPKLTRKARSVLGPREYTGVSKTRGRVCRQDRNRHAISGARSSMASGTAAGHAPQSDADAAVPDHRLEGASTSSLHLDEISSASHRAPVARRADPRSRRQPAEVGRGSRRVEKPQSKRSDRRQGKLATPPTRRSLRQPSHEAPPALRRSSRVPKRPDFFRPG